MQEKEVKKLINYDLKRVISYANKQFGKIERGTEEDYNPQLNYIEHKIYEVYEKINISDYDLQTAIEITIYDLKGYVDNKIYDYTELVDKKVINYAKELQELFNPFINKDIKVNNEGKNNLKELFTLPIICLVRIYSSVDFWRNRYGKNGYFKMLKEMVIPIMQIGEFPYALEEKYLKEENEAGEENELQ